MMNVIMMNVIMMNVIMMNVIMMNVIMMNVVAPIKRTEPSLSVSIPRYYSLSLVEFSELGAATAYIDSLNVVLRHLPE
jgi:hypothetical protein